MTKRNKKYNPTNKYNPVFQALKIEKLSENVDRFKKVLESLSKSNDNHISYLGNFARHDIKNAIQSMDSILTTNSPAEFNQDMIDSLAAHLNVIRSTMENFVKLVPYSTDGKFKIDALFTAAELLNRAEIQQVRIDLEFKFNRNTDFEIKLPFQSLLQMLNNLIVNSIKALDETEDKRILVEGNIDKESFYIRISDNGKHIPEEDKSKVFEYGYTTTGGSGIGLYHAQYLCELFGGTISLDLCPEKDFNKIFSVNLPTIRKDGENDINNRR
jgi:signal transduction histidine kinase